MMVFSMHRIEDSIMSSKKAKIKKGQAGMPIFEPATDDQYGELFQLMREDAGDYLSQSLALMKISWEQFAQLFRTVGQVFTINQDGCLAGIYWIEERAPVLHLHGLILKVAFQGIGIGTAVLKMLTAQYQSKLDAIELGVHRSNEGAIRLYKRLGFEVVEILDDLGYAIMRKSLIPLDK